MELPGSIGRPTKALGTLGLSDTCQAQPDELVGEEGHAVIYGLVVEEAHGLRVVDLAEQALAGPEHDGEDLQPQLVDEAAPSISAGRSWKLAKTRISPSRSCLSFETSSMAAPLSSYSSRIFESLFD
jgi:hypothetical protein